MWSQYSSRHKISLFYVQESQPLFFSTTGIREAEINVAEGRKKARVLQSEAYQSEQVNQAKGEANALLAKANARSEAIRVIAEALGKEVCILYIIEQCFMW